MLSYLIEVFLLLLYFGNIEQQTPHLSSELQGNPFIDPPDQLEGNKQQGVIVRKAFKDKQLNSPQKLFPPFRPEHRFLYSV